MARVLRLLSAPKLMELTGNSFGSFNNHTLLDTVRQRHLDDGGVGEFFARQGKVLQIAFFAEDDGATFQEAFFFNFTVKGVQLSDFSREGRGSFKKLYEVEKCVRFLQSFWDLVYQGTDALGPLPAGKVLEPLLRLLDASVLLQVLTAEYVGAVIDMSLRAAAATLDKALPPGETKTPREWWLVVTEQLGRISFSKENQDLFEVSKARLGGKEQQQGLAKEAPIAGGGKSGGPAVVSPAKPSTAHSGGEEVCFTALKHLYQLPANSPACASANCTRLHPDKFKHTTASHVVGLLSTVRGDTSDLMRAVLADTVSFRG
jgi:hypothetical protein